MFVNKLQKMHRKKYKGQQSKYNFLFCVSNDNNDDYMIIVRRYTRFCVNDEQSYIFL